MLKKIILKPVNIATYILIASILLISSCDNLNLFCWAYSPGSSDNPELLYNDAEILRRHGEHDDAICIYADILNNYSISDELRAEVQTGYATALILKYFNYEDLVPTLYDILITMQEEEDNQEVEEAIETIPITQFFFQNTDGVSTDSDRPGVSASTLIAERAYQALVDYSIRSDDSVNKVSSIECDYGTLDIEQSILEHFVSVRQLIPHMDIRYVNNEINFAMSVFIKLFMSLLDSNGDLEFNSDPENAGDDLDLITINVDKIESGYRFRNEITKPDIIDTFNELKDYANEDLESMNPNELETNTEANLIKINDILSEMQCLDSINRQIANNVSTISKHFEEATLVSRELVESGLILMGTFDFVKQIKDWIVVGDEENSSVLDRLWEFRRDNIAVRGLLVCIKLQMLRTQNLIAASEIVTDAKITKSNETDTFDMEAEVQSLSGNERSILQDYFTDLCIENGGTLAARSEADMLGTEVYCDEATSDECPAVFRMDLPALDCWNHNGTWDDDTRECTEYLTCYGSIY